MTVQYWCHECEKHVEIKDLRPNSSKSTDSSNGTDDGRDSREEDVECVSCGGCFVEKQEVAVESSSENEILTVNTESPNSSDHPVSQQNSENRLPAGIFVITETIDLPLSSSASEEGEGTGNSGLLSGSIPQLLLSLTGLRGSDGTGISIGDGGIGNGGMDDILHRILMMDSGNKGSPPATAEVINSLKEKKRKPTEAEIVSSTQCSICQEDFTKDKDLIELNCDHRFCESCIVPWLEKHNTCPVCRVEVSSSENSTAESTS